MKTEKRFPDYTPLDRVLLPFRHFASEEVSGGVLLLFAAVAALIWANSPYRHVYHHLWELPFSVGFEQFNVSRPLHAWINDGLMVMFFFVIGLELKRELIAGELASIRSSLLPIAAAAGGMIFPAIIYLAFNVGTPAARGWGIPMATDIAFALGVMALLGKRIPGSLKLFLTALAIVDDLGAVIVIALFYTSSISVVNLLVGVGFLAFLCVANLMGVRNWIFYAVFGIGGVWLFFLLSGVHPTIAGVLAAFTIPAGSRIDSNAFVKEASGAVDLFKRSDQPGGIMLDPLCLSALLRLKGAYEDAVTPLQRIENALHPWVVFIILPLFALSNAGVEFDFDFAVIASDPIAFGIAAGALAGKTAGIALFAWLTVKTGFTSLPKEVNWGQMIGVSVLAGMGFTMSLFIAALAFEPPAIAVAKVSILAASAAAGVAGWAILAWTSRPNRVSA